MKIEEINSCKILNLNFPQSPPRLIKKNRPSRVRMSFFAQNAFSASALDCVFSICYMESFHLIKYISAGRLGVQHSFKNGGTSEISVILNMGDDDMLAWGYNLVICS